MSIRDLFKLLYENKEFEKYLDLIKRESKGQLIHGLTEGQKSFWIGAVSQKIHRPTIVVTENITEARNSLFDLSNYFDEGQVEILPPRESLLHGIYAKSHEVTEERIKVLTKVIQDEVKCLILPAETLSQKLIPKNSFKEAHFKISTGLVFPHFELIDKLVYLGYERVDLVQNIGQFSVRGDIFDIFPTNQNTPFRMEFFDDEVETIKYFDPVTQRSKGTTDSFWIPPAREVLMDESMREKTIERLKSHGEAYINKIAAKGRRSSARKLRDMLDEWVGYLKDRLWKADLDKLQPFIYSEQSSIFDYFNKSPVVFILEPMRVLEALNSIEEKRAITLTELMDMGKAFPGFKDSDYSMVELKELLQDKSISYLSALPREIPDVKLTNIISFTGKNILNFQGKIKILIDELKTWKKRGYIVALTVSSMERAKRLKEYLWEEKIEIPIIKELSLEQNTGRVFITLGNISKGFEIPEIKLVVISDEELFGKKKHGRVIKTFKDGAKIGHYGELKPGDYVVHVQHGIGQYLGIEQLNVGGINRDYLNIQYFGQDKLYLPTDQIELIQKYVGAEGHKPKLHKLGGSDWQRVKTRVKESVQEMAKKLLELYATREAVKGYKFSPDDEMQALFEDAFPYNETPDQLTAIEEVKKDMCSSRPMDRLICGDVGYGKTEVALRAAFKAVRDSKQVAVLVPTTVLAQQHYKTFSERFADFPVKVDTLSRFRTAKEQKNVVEGIKNGTVDIVIGTHRLLSKDVVFKDLGLLIIDEEQRFGVSHKEKIKHMRKNVDVLTLTATPIPRTMHMALAGVRDMSVIETPPEDRYPVQTYVLEYSDNLVRDAIRKEIDRGGQVYYIHNRIEDIDKVKLHLENLVPDVSIGVAHGKMKEDFLEQEMLRFMEGEYQVLLCTTIIENGLDISNVNTLIVDEADKLGLSQLYQIRGRVGRSNRIAYAYFTYRKNKVLNQQAEKRLAAIREFTEFGSGFKIAKRDMEIRGAGNILGPEQHGHMLAIGFDLYCRLLEDAVKKQKGQLEKEVEQETMEMEVNISAYISNKYIPDSSQIMDIYQELGACETTEEVKTIEESLIDRFGHMPQETENLITLTHIKVIAKSLGVKKIKHVGDQIEIVFSPDFVIKGEKLLEIAKGAGRRITFSGTTGLVIKIRTNKLSQQEIMDLLENIFHRLSAIEAKQQH